MLFKCHCTLNSYMVFYNRKLVKHFVLMFAFPWLQSFTQSMRLERLSLEQKMESLSSQSEHTDESDRKRMTTKVWQDALSWHTVGRLLEETSKVELLFLFVLSVCLYWVQSFKSVYYNEAASGPPGSQELICSCPLTAFSVSSRAHGHPPIRCQLWSHHWQVWQ